MTQTDTSRKFTPPRVLVVDDDHAVLAVLRRLLQLAGYDVLSATNGADGYHLLQTDPAISLLILDLTLPVLDGWRFRQMQRQDAALAAIPTVILTGAPLPSVVDAELQAADYLFKPVGADHFLSVVRHHCGPAS
jgi:CheY-like chemotaxis protein